MLSVSHMSQYLLFTSAKRPNAVDVALLGCDCLNNGYLLSSEYDRYEHNSVKIATDQRDAIM